MFVLALLLAASQPGEDPAAFIRRVYAGYNQSGYSSLLHPEKLFSPTLAAAMRLDSSGGEVGYLDGDPLCDCQDFVRISARIVSIKRPTARSASAKVHVTLGPKVARDLKLSLVLTSSGWRIADVVDPHGHSLLKELQRSNAERARSDSNYLPGRRGFYGYPRHRHIDRGSADSGSTGRPLYGSSSPNFDGNYGSAYYGPNYGAPYFGGGYYDGGVYYRERRD